MVFRDVKKLLGNTTTYSTDIERIGKQLLGTKLHGVYASDKIPKLTNRRPYAILNLDKSYEPGSHWIGLAKNGKNAIIYDSFGRHHTKIIPSVNYSGNGKILSTDLDAEQGDHETNCGSRSLSWLVFFDKYGAEEALMI